MALSPRSYLSTSSRTSSNSHFSSSNSSRQNRAPAGHKLEPLAPTSDHPPKSGGEFSYLSASRSSQRVDPFLQRYSLAEDEDPMLPDLTPRTGGNARKAGGSEIGSNFSPQSGDLDRPPQAELVRAFGIDSEDEVADTAGLPSGVAVSRCGNILVVDNTARLGKVFSPSGYLKYSFGAGMLQSPWGIFESQSGKIVVSDSRSADMKVFSSTGKFLQTSEVGYHLMRPLGIAYHPTTKHLLVADPDSCCVYVHNPDGIVHHIITVADDNFRPTYVYYDRGGNIYVTDADSHKLHVFDEEYDLKFSYGEQGNGPGQLSGPGGVCVDKHGNILLVDSGNSRVHLLDKTGTFQDSVLTWEDGLAGPQAITVDDKGCLVVTEAGTGLVKVYAYDHLPCVTGEKAANEGKDQT